MKRPADNLPDDISELKGIIAEQVLKIQKNEDKVDHYCKEANLYRSDLQIKDEELTAKEKDLTDKRAYIERLEEMVRLLRHSRFGRSSEKLNGDGASNQLGFFDEAETEEEKSHMQDTSVEVKGYKRRGKPKRVKLPEDLPREDVIIDIDENEKVCPEGHELKCIGEDVSEQLDVIPAQIKVIRTIRKKYACPCCEGHVKRAPCPKTAIPKSIAGAGLLAYIATSKYGDGLPLYRQEHMFQRIGVDIPRGTMAIWMMKVGDLLTPVINLMEEDLLESEYAQGDETRVQVLNEAGRSTESQSFMWVRGRHYIGAPPIVLFDYDPTRSGSVAERLFDGFEGYLQVDAYAGYNAVCSKEGVVRVGCWAHARRKFFEAKKASKKGEGLASEAMKMIGQLYEVEKAIRDDDKVRDNVDERLRIRLEKSKPVVDEFREWLNENLGKAPPKSQIGIALNYAHNEWPQLVRFMEDGRLSIDNNMVENAIRPFAVGRKNWLFSNSVAGVKASAAIYSIMISAKQNGHNEYAYFRYLLERIPLAEKIEDFEALLPHRLSPNDVPSITNN